MTTHETREILLNGKKVCDWSCEVGKKNLISFKKDYYIIITNEQDLIIEGSKFDKHDGGFILELIRIYEKKMRNKYKSIYK